MMKSTKGIKLLFVQTSCNEVRFNCQRALNIGENLNKNVIIKLANNGLNSYHLSITLFHFIMEKVCLSKPF